MFSRTFFNLLILIPVHTFKHQTEVLNFYRNVVLQNELNKLEHVYCYGYLEIWINMCEIAFRYLREEDEYKDLLYVNYKVFKNDVKHKCEKIDLILPDTAKPIPQFHRTCFGCSKIISLDQPYFNDDISVFPIGWPTLNMIVFRKINVNSGNNQYQLLDYYDIYKGYLIPIPKDILICSIPKSKRGKQQVNDFLYENVDKLKSKKKKQNILEINSSVFRNVCNVVYGRPEYKDIYIRPSSRIKVNYSRPETVELFLIHENPSMSISIDVPAYTCEGILNKRMYKIMAGLKEDSVVVLQGPVDVEDIFLTENVTIYTAFELIEKLKIYYVNYIDHN